MLPRQIGHPFEIGPNDAVLGGRGRCLLQALEFAHRLLVCLFGHLRRFDPFAHAVGFGLIVFHFAEFAANCFQLLAQHVVALAATHFGLHLVANFGLDFHRVALTHEFREHVLETIFDAGDLKNLLLARDVEVEVRRHEVSKPRRVVEACGEHVKLVRQARALAHQRRKLLAHISNLCCSFDRVAVPHVVEHAHIAAEKILVRKKRLDRDPSDALNEQAIRVVGKADHLDDPKNSANRVNVVWPGASLNGVLHRTAHHESRVALSDFINQVFRTHGVHQQR